ncbi:hypothetical protein OUZ56_013793 [Daphnia magna]|uniref:Uncharacterized protein n=1 Tax=Daphnia magna TaxID=35525 RepID=A0ABQ9Z6Z2_9CRUS|nr:hypothetical protein OUZ56_013793 [Daphnia magna]
MPTVNPRARCSISSGGIIDMGSIVSKLGKSIDSAPSLLIDSTRYLASFAYVNQVGGHTCPA